MKIYLAARYGLRLMMCGVRDRLQAEGHEVTSRWLTGEYEGLPPERAAHDDVFDLRMADALVAFSDKRSESHPGGGRHVEFGIALERGMTIYVVGSKGEHVFHYWPGVRFFDTLDDLIEAIKLQRKEAAE